MWSSKSHKHFNSRMDTSYKGTTGSSGFLSVGEIIKPLEFRFLMRERFKKYKWAKEPKKS